MFTGLVEEVGRVGAVEPRPGGRLLWIEAARVIEDASIGDSISMNGCCLTAVAVEPGRFAFEAVPETLARTTLGQWVVGTPVNLERSLRLDQRLGGHILQGHVDGVGSVSTSTVEGDGRRLVLTVPAGLRRFVAEKGAIAVDGVSLTVARVTPEGLEVALIPHTLKMTVSAHYAAGTRVNLEVDVIARYVARLLEEPASSERIE